MNQNQIAVLGFLILIMKSVQSFKTSVNIYQSKRRQGRRRIKPSAMLEWEPHISHHTYLLTPWCRVLLEKLTGLQLVKKFPAFFWNPYAPHTQPISFLSILSPVQYWVKSTDHSAPRYAISSINIVFRTKHKGCVLRKANDKRTQPSAKFDPTNKYSIW